METLEHASNVDLLAALAGKPAAEALVQHYGGLTALAQASFDELKLVKGIGQSKAAAIKSAFLLAQRLSREVYPEAPLMDTPERVADLLREQNRPYVVENFQVIFLNTRRRMIGMQVLSQGTLDTLLVHPREVFRAAIAAGAAAIEWLVVLPEHVVRPSLLGIAIGFSAAAAAISLRAGAVYRGVLEQGLPCNGPATRSG